MSATWIDRFNAIFALVCDLLALYVLLGIMLVVLLMWREHRRTRGLSASSANGLTGYAGGSDELSAKVPPWLDRFYLIAMVVMTWPWTAYWTLMEGIAGDEPGGRHELQRVEAGGHDDE